MTVENARRFSEWWLFSSRVATFKAPHEISKHTATSLSSPGSHKHRVAVTYMAEAALVLAVGGSSRVLAVLRLGFLVVLLKPAQDKVPEEPGQQQNTERL